MNGRVLMPTPLNSGRVLTPYFDKALGLEVYPRLVKHSKNFPSVFGGHLVFVDIPLRQEEGYYIYSLRVGGSLCLLR